MTSFAVAIALASVTSKLNAVQDEKKNFFPDQLNLSVPSSAALDVLKVDASKVTSPTSLQQVAFGLVEAFDESGKLQTGFAFNFPVIQLKPTVATTLYPIHKVGPKQGQVVDKPFHLPRTLYLANISAAGVRGTDDDASARAAISLSLPIIDRTDWRRDERAQADFRAEAAQVLLSTTVDPVDADEFIGEQLRNWRSYANEVTRILGDDTPEAVKNFSVVSDKHLNLISVNEKPGSISDPDNGRSWTDEVVPALERMLAVEDKTGSAVDGIAVKKARDRIRTKYNAKKWNSHKIDISVAHSLFAEDSNTGGLKGEGLAWSLGWVVPVEEMQLTLVGRSANMGRTWDNDAQSWQIANSFEYGARIRGGSLERGFFVEYLVSQDDIRGGDDRTRTLLQGGYEVKLSETQWLQIALGQGSGGTARTLFGINLSFNLSPVRELPHSGAN